MLLVNVPHEMVLSRPIEPDQDYGEFSGLKFRIFPFSNKMLVFKIGIHKMLV